MSEDTVPDRKNEGNLEELGLHNQILNLAAIKRERHIPAFVKNLITELEKKGTLPVGLWLKNLPHMDFFSLKSAIRSLQGAHCDLPPDEEARCVASVGLITCEILALGEGLSIPKTLDERIIRVKILEHFINVESLFRKGLPIEIYYKNMSLDETIDSSDEKGPIIAKLLGSPE